jgi:SAM-dependent methyltransferase
MDSREPGYRGFKDYKPLMLRTYDPWVVGFVSPRVWKMGPEPGIDLYRRHMGERHLDIGPGTGYFISEAQPPANTELTLLDANPHVLDHCAQVLAAWRPATVRGNVLEPLPVEGPFDSVGLTHVIHCLPGPIGAKATAIRNAAAVLGDDGVLFGGTVLGMSADHGLAARLFLRLANLQGGFDNRDDDVEGLRSVLEASFEDVDIQLPTPSMGYFVATRPRRSPESG